MLNRTRLKDRKPNDLIASWSIEIWMDVVNEIYAIERDHDEEHRLDALQKYISWSDNRKERSLISGYLSGDMPDCSTYEELRTMLLVNVVAENISRSYKLSKIIPCKEELDRITQFFDNITVKQHDNDEGQDVAELCDAYGVEWDTVKNFKRHDHDAFMGIVRSKTDKLTKITYVYRDPSKTFYGKVDTTDYSFLDDMPDDCIS